MPQLLPKEMPVYGLLQKQDPSLLATTCQNTQVLRLLFLNLMSDKIGTELQYLRCLGTCPQQIQVDFMRQVSFRSANQDEAYLQKFYLCEDTIQDRYYDAMLITGAPLEHISCEDTRYWEEFCRILAWSKTHVKHIFAGCWGAFAALYRDHGITKTSLPKKISGIFPLRLHAPQEPIFRNCGDIVYVPISRATDMDLSAVMACDQVQLLADACDGTPVFLKSKDGQFIYCTAHPEYECERLAFEYDRDKDKPHKWVTSLPENYFPNNDPASPPRDHWVAQGQQIFRNWINYYVR